MAAAAGSNGRVGNAVGNAAGATPRPHRHQQQQCSAAGAYPTSDAPAAPATGRTPGTSGTGWRESCGMAPGAAEWMLVMQLLLQQGGLPGGD